MGRTFPKFLCNATSCHWPSSETNEPAVPPAHSEVPGIRHTPGKTWKEEKRCKLSPFVGLYRLVAISTSPIKVTRIYIFPTGTLESLNDHEKETKGGDPNLFCKSDLP